MAQWTNICQAIFFWFSPSVNYDKISNDSEIFNNLIFFGTKKCFKLNATFI